MVIRVQDKSLIGLVSLGCAVHGSCGCEGSLGNDLAESDGLIVLGYCVFVPHPDYNLFGSEEDLFWKCLGISCAHLVIGEELLVDSFGPGFGDLVVRRGSGGG